VGPLVGTGGLALIYLSGSQGRLDSCTYNTIAVELPPRARPPHRRYRVSVNFEYKIGNRKLSQAEWERNLREAPIEAVKDSIKKKVRRVRCTTHGQTARVSFVKTNQGFDTKLSGCCDELMQLVQRALT
jgi:hypothetical protein